MLFSWPQLLRVVIWATTACQLHSPLTCLLSNMFPSVELFDWVTSWASCVEIVCFRYIQTSLSGTADMKKLLTWTVSQVRQWETNAWLQTHCGSDNHKRGMEKTSSREKRKSWDCSYSMCVCQKEREGKAGNKDKKTGCLSQEHLRPRRKKKRLKSGRKADK